MHKISSEHATVYYSVWQLDNMAELRGFFTDETDYEMNWLFVGTSGVHGSYSKLAEWEESQGTEEPLDRITVLVVMPRIVRVLYGDIEITQEDVTWMRGVVDKTLTAINETQYANTTKSWSADA